MKVKSINFVGKLPVYDLSVDSEDYDEQHYILENGVVTHNTGVMYSANTAFIIGRQQDKGTDGELDGYNFIINIEKSRFVKEKSKIPLKVSFDSGVSEYSGMLDLALEAQEIVKPSNGWYQLVDKTTGEMIGGKVRQKDTETPDFLGVVLKRDSFKEFIKNKYKLGAVNMNNQNSEVEETEIDE